MKIVVSGSAGTGKTTLVKKIAEGTGFPIIRDFADTVLRERGYKNFKQVVNPSMMRQIRLQALFRKIQMENSMESFVSDKGVADYYAYWMNVAMHEASQKENDMFYEETKGHIKIYDLVIIPPFGRFEIEDNKLRTTNLHYQFRNHCMIKGLYNEFGIPWAEYAMNLEDNSDKIIKDLGIAV